VARCIAGCCHSWNACAIERVLGSWVQATATAPSDEPLALDGKTLRGARSGEQTAPHLLAFVTHHSQETFWQVRVDEKTMRSQSLRGAADVAHPAARVYG